MDTFVVKQGAKLPQEVSLISLIQSRYSEINQLINEFKARSPKLAAQKLPIHMRRRAASHNINRLPSKTRIIISKKSKGKDTISECKEKKRKQSKKYRNQNKLNLSHAVREAKTDRSLLHVWFVKRFKMINLFGQIVPHHNTTKNQRKIHKMSKIGCSYFHLPQFKSVVIRIKNIDYVCRKFSDLSKDDLKPFFIEHGSPAAKWTRFHADCVGHKAIVPGYLIFNPNHNFLIIWCHILIKHKIFDHLLASFRDSNDEVIDGDKFYQLFSLIGPESLHHLKKVLSDSNSSLPNVWTYGNVFSIGSHAACRESKRGLDVGEAEGNCIMVNMMKVNNREIIFVTVPRSDTIEFWHKLVKNMTHFVGGLREFKILTSEMRCLHYPSIGYPDLPIGNHPHQKTWSHIMKLNTDCPDYFLLRDQILLNKLKRAHPNISYFKELLVSSPNLKHSFIFVELITINRGTLEEGDIICLPTAEDVAKFIGTKIKLKRIGYGPVECQKIATSSMAQSSRKVIGLVEFGYFSMDLGASKGFGGVTFLSLSDLIELNNEKLIALTRSPKSDTFRFVEIVIDCFNSF